MDRLGFEPRTSCLQSRRSSADLPAPTRAERRGADETFREDSRSRGSTLIRIPEMKGPWVVPRTEPSDGLSGMRISVEPRRSEEHTSELQSRSDLVCRLLLEKKKIVRQSTCNCHQH